MRRNLNAVFAFLLMAQGVSIPALARGNDLVINDGFGEQVTVKHGFFGRNTKVVKDRLGDGFGEKTGLFGSKQEDVNLLGNKVERKVGLLGGSDIRGSSIFGDQVETRKGIFGRRTTYVDASGTASVVRNLWNQNKGKILGSSNAFKSPMMDPQALPNPAAPMGGQVPADGLGGSGNSGN